MKASTYARAGVDTAKEDVALSGLLKWVGKTLSLGSKPVRLEAGYFASVIDMGNNLGLAISTDGVGTKILVAQMLQRYDTIGIDCVAMNVNDVLCVGAEPLCMVDYIAVEKPDPQILEEIGKGLYEGARQANISIPGGEMAQLREMVRGVKRGQGFDLAGTCIGTVPVDRVIIGQNIREGDVVLGLPSSGIHSNGLTLARHVLFKRVKLRPDKYMGELGKTVGEELLEPTRIYVKEVLDLLRSGINVKALIHITGDGLLNLTRVKSEVGYIIEDLPEPHPIFSLIQGLGNISDEEMFKVFNMGIGFCLVIPESNADKAFEVLKRHKVEAYRIGYATPDRERKVLLKPKGLVGKGGSFIRLKTKRRLKTQDQKKGVA